MVVFELSNIYYADHKIELRKWAHLLGANDCIASPYVVASCKYKSYVNPVPLVSTSAAPTPHQFQGTTKGDEDSEFYYKTLDHCGTTKISGNLPILQSYVEYTAICEDYYDNERQESAMVVLNILKVGFRKYLRVRDLNFILKSKGVWGKDFFSMFCLSYEEAKRKFTKTNVRLSPDDLIHLSLLKSKPILLEQLVTIMDEAGCTNVSKYPAVYKIFIHLAPVLIRQLPSDELVVLNRDLTFNGEAWKMLSLDNMVLKFPFLSACIKYTLWLDEITDRMLIENPQFFNGGAIAGKRPKEIQPLSGKWCVFDFLNKANWVNQQSYTYARDLLRTFIASTLDESIQYMKLDKQTSHCLANMKRKLMVNPHSVKTTGDDKKITEEAILVHNHVIMPYLSQTGNTLFKFNEIQALKARGCTKKHLDVLIKLGFLAEVESKSIDITFKNPLIREFMKDGMDTPADTLESAPTLMRTAYALPDHVNASRDFLKTLHALPSKMTQGLAGGSNNMVRDEFSYRRLDLMFSKETQRCLSSSGSDDAFGELKGKSLDYWQSVITLDESQLACIKAVISTPVTMVVACPGRGKTVVIEAMYCLFGGNHDTSDRVSVVTHGGCMASNLRERGILKAKTICKVLVDSIKSKYVTSPSTKQRSNVPDVCRTSEKIAMVEDRRLTYEDVRVLIIDESSNVSQDLMAEITSKRTFPNLERIVLVLDVTQTLPYGPGSPAIDLVKNSKKWPNQKSDHTTAPCGEDNQINGVVTTCVLTNAHRFYERLSTNCLNDDCILKSKLEYVAFGTIGPDLVANIVHGDAHVPVEVDNHAFTQINQRGKILVNSFSITHGFKNGASQPLLPRRVPASQEMNIMKRIAATGGFYKIPFGASINNTMRKQHGSSDGVGECSPRVDYMSLLKDLLARGSNEEVQILALSKKVRDDINAIFDASFGLNANAPHLTNFNNFRLPKGRSSIGRGDNSARLNRGTNVHYLGQKVVFKKNTPSRIIPIDVFGAPPEGLLVADSSIGHTTAQQEATVNRVVDPSVKRAKNEAVSKLLDRFSLNLLREEGHYMQSSVYNGQPGVFLGVVDLYVGPIDYEVGERYCKDRQCKKQVTRESACRLINAKRWLSSQSTVTTFSLEDATKNPLKVMTPHSLVKRETPSALNVSLSRRQYFKTFAFFTNGIRIALDETSQQLVEPGWCITVDSSQGREYESAMLVIQRENVNSIFGLRHVHVALSRAKRHFLLLGGVERFLSLAKKDTDILDSRKTFLDHLLTAKIK